MLDAIIHTWNSLEFLTQVVIILELALFLWFMRKFTVSNAYKAPAILTTCGILGTFLGITWGLNSFNADDIQQSVPALIDGIKTAFWASTCGVLFALVIKLREIFFGVSSTGEEQSYDGATVDDLANLLKDIKNALIGSDESAILGQIKLARQDSNERIESLSQSLDEFVENVADNNSSALIDALSTVTQVK